MGSFWNELLESSNRMTNVNIVCSDGVIASHKIIVASASDFIKNIMISIPVGDDITIFLLDFEKYEVEEFLSLNGAVKKERDIFKDTGSDWLNMEQKHIQNIQQEIVGDNFNNYNAGQFHPEIGLTKENRIMKDDIFTDLLEVKQEMEEEEPSCSYKKLSPNKKTSSGKGKEKKIAYDKAIAYYKSEENVSVRHAALKYNVEPKTLGFLIKSGKSYTGSGKKSTMFSEEEEKFLVNQAHQKMEAGEELSSKILKELIGDYIEVLKGSNPDRNLKVDENFVRCFSKRHGLKQFYKGSVQKPGSSQKQGSVKTPKSLPKKSLKDNVQLNYSCEDLEKDLIPNPTTKKEKQRNEVIQKKINFEKALAYYKSEENVSMREAALKYNVEPKTLGLFVRTGKSYQGSGRQPTTFTKEEENVIVSRVMEIVKNGQYFDLKVLKQIIEEEINTININFSDRNIRMTNNFVQYFANKYELKKFVPEDNKVRDFECEVCLKKFTFKKAMIAHQKTIHYSFLT